MKPQNSLIIASFNTDCSNRHHLLPDCVINIKLILYILYVGSFTGMAQPSVNIAELYFSMCTHDIPAYAPFAEHSLASFTFRNDFCVPELMYKSLEIHLLHEGNVFHLRTSHDGYARFGEIRVDAGYGRRFGHRLSISLTGTYIAQHAEHYRSRHSFTVNLSAHCLLTPHWGVAVGLFNPIRMRYGITGQEVIPMVFSLQIHHRWDEKMLAFLQIKKTLPGGFDVGGGLFCRPLQHLLLTGSCSLRQIGIGVCLPWRHLLVGIQTAWYYRISFSNAATVHYLFNL